QSALQAHRTGQGTGSTTTKKLSVRASRVSVAVKMHAPALTVGVQVAFAEVELAATTGCTIVPAHESDNASVPVGHASNEKMTVYGVPLWNGTRMVASAASRATAAIGVGPLKKAIELITGCGTNVTVTSIK